MFKNNLFYMTLLLITLLVSVLVVRVICDNFKYDLLKKGGNITTIDSASKRFLFKKIIRLLK